MVKSRICARRWRQSNVKDPTRGRSSCRLFHRPHNLGADRVAEPLRLYNDDPRHYHQKQQPGQRERPQFARCGARGSLERLLFKYDSRIGALLLEPRIHLLIHRLRRSLGRALRAVRALGVGWVGEGLKR